MKRPMIITTDNFKLHLDRDYVTVTAKHKKANKRKRASKSKRRKK